MRRIDVVMIAIGLAVMAAGVWSHVVMAGYDEVDFTCGWDRAGSGAGYGYSVSRGTPAHHAPSPRMALASGKALHSLAQDGQAQWAAGMPSGVATWYVGLTSDEKAGVYMCERDRPSYQ